MLVLWYSNVFYILATNSSSDSDKTINVGEDSSEVSRAPSYATIDPQFRSPRRRSRPNSPNSNYFISPSISPSVDSIDLLKRGMYM